MWQKTLAELGEERGFYRKLGAEHNALFLQGDGTLVVSFDNLDDVRQDVGERVPWGRQFISPRGWSSLGIEAHGWTWYKDDDVMGFFGTSMAGYAAGAFCSAVPGAKVIMMDPQATLDRGLTGGWESRYSRSWRQDFSGRYGYAPEHARRELTAYVFFDLMMVEDAMHAALFHGENIVEIKCGHFGHGLTSALSQMGILTRAVEACVGGAAIAGRVVPDDAGAAPVAKVSEGGSDQVEVKGQAAADARLLQGRAGDRPRPYFLRAMQEARKAGSRRAGASVIRHHTGCRTCRP